MQQALALDRDFEDEGFETLPSDPLRRVTSRLSLC